MGDGPPDPVPDTDEPPLSPHEVPDEVGFPDEEVEIEEPREDEIPSS